MIGDTIVDIGGRSPVTIEVNAPSWVAVNELTVYSNGGTVVSDQSDPGAGHELHDDDHGASAVVGADMWIVAESSASTEPCFR